METSHKTIVSNESEKILIDRGGPSWHFMEKKVFPRKELRKYLKSTLRVKGLEKQNATKYTDTTSKSY